MNFEYIEIPFSREVNGRSFSAVVPVNINAPDFAKRNYMGNIHFYVWTLSQSLSGSTSLDEVKRAVDRYLDNVGKAVALAGWGVIKVKVGKGVSIASVRAELDCWVGENLANGERKQVSSSFFAPASSVMECQEKGYGMLSEWFVAKKLAEVAERARYKSQKYNRVPVSQAICAPHVLGEVRKRMMTQFNEPYENKHEISRR